VSWRTTRLVAVAFPVFVAFGGVVPAWTICVGQAVPWASTSQRGRLASTAWTPVP
jgi:hypothetical protein